MDCYILLERWHFYRNGQSRNLVEKGWMNDRKNDRNDRKNDRKNDCNDRKNDLYFYTSVPFSQDDYNISY